MLFQFDALEIKIIKKFCTNILVYVKSYFSSLGESLNESLNITFFSIRVLDMLVDFSVKLWENTQSD
jgi:hypothetical protein